MSILGEAWVAIRPETTGFGKEVTGKLETIFGNASPLGIAAAGVGAATAGVVAVTALGAKFQSTTTQIAANANISVGAANRIGQAFLGTAFQSIFSGQQMASAFAAVAGQLGQTEGHALSARQALDFMRTAADLAEASGAKLGSTTSALAQTMQAFHLQTGQAASASDVLFNVSRTLNLPIDTVASAMARLHGRLGDLGGSLPQVGTLLEAMGPKLGGGTRGINLVNSALEKLVASGGKTSEALGKQVASSQTAVTKTTTDLSKAQQNLNDVMARLGASGSAAAARGVGAASRAQDALTRATDAQTRAQQHLQDVQRSLGSTVNLSLSQQTQLRNAHDAVTRAAGAVTTAQTNLATATQKAGAAAGLSVTQQQELSRAQQAVAAATDAHNKAVNALASAHAGLVAPSDEASKTIAALGLHVFNAQGQFLGMRSIIEQLQPRLASMTQQQRDLALQTLFGSGAAQVMGNLISQGVGAFDSATAAVTRHGSAHAAAAKQAGTLAHQFDVVKAGMQDWLTKAGLAVIPVLERIAADVLHALPIIGSDLVAAFHALKGPVTDAAAVGRDFIGVVSDIISWISSVISWFSQMSAPALAVASAIGLVLIPSLVSLGVTGAATFARLIASAVGWAIAQARDIAETVTLWAMYAAESVASVARATVGIVANNAKQLASFVVLIAGHTAGAAVWIAQNIAMAASATAAFVAENAATLGILAALAALIAGAVWVATHWHQVWTDIKHWAEDAWHFLDDVIHNKIVNIILAIIAPALFLLVHWKATWDVIKSIVSDAWNDVLKPTIRFIVDAFLGMVGALTKGAADAFGWVPFVGGKLKDAAKSITDFKKTVDQALGSGSNVGADAGKQIGQNVTQGFRSHMGMSSPSRVFREFGVNLIQGLASGITSGGPQAQDALTRLGLKAPNIAGMAPGGGVGPAAGPLQGPRGTTLDDVHDCLKDISGALETANLGNTFHITSTDPVVSAAEAAQKFRGRQYRLGRG